MTEIVHETKSICPECLKVINAELLEENGQIKIRKTCEEHGEFKEIYWSNIEHYKWVVPTSNYDSRLAPKGKQLVGFAFILPEEYNPGEMKKKALGAIFDIIPDTEKYIDMIHYQELIPEKASWSINSGFGDVKTPIKNLYCVGTDAEKRSAGVSRAAYSVLRCLETMESNKFL